MSYDTPASILPATITSVVWSGGPTSAIQNFTVNVNAGVDYSQTWYASYTYTTGITTLTTGTPTTTEPPIPNKVPVAQNITVFAIPGWGDGQVVPAIQSSDAPQQGVVKITFSNLAQASGPIGKVVTV